jgi:hypothetical protein
MTLARLLLAALLICSLPAFSQDQQLNTSQIPSSPISSAMTSAVTSKNAAVAPSEPWNIFPNLPADLRSDSKERIRVDQFRYDPDTFDFRTGRSKWEPKTRELRLGTRPDGDTTCYAIRSYVVARDSKDSDSTHPAGYSTCQRASRYHLKTTVGEPAPAK